MIKTKVIKNILATCLTFLLMLSPALAQSATGAELQNLDPDPMINALLNNLSSGGVVSEVMSPTPAPVQAVQIEHNSLAGENETILTPVDSTSSVTAAPAVANPAAPVVANTLSSRIIVPSQPQATTEGGNQALPTTVAPVPLATAIPTTDVEQVSSPAPQAQTIAETNQSLESQSQVDRAGQPGQTGQTIRNLAQTKPKLFDVAWLDSEVYKVNLVPSAWPSLERVASSSVYHIQLSIADSLRQVEAKQEVLVRNSEAVTLDNLYFHLYPNLLGGAIRINRLEVAGQPVAVGLERNNSLLNINLPVPLAPKEAVTVYMEYSVELPQNSQRNYGLFGIDESILSLGHAYPQLAVFNETGWALETPPSHGDVVHADTAFYLVEITAPQRVVVSASGTVFPNLTARSTPVSQQRFTVAAGPVRDFYLTASQDYAVAERNVGQTKLRVYYPRTIHSEVRPRVEQLLDQTAVSLAIFSERLAAYPYTELDISAISTAALGVEYPSIIGMSTRFFDNSTRLYGYDLKELLESTIVHEVGHQWFYGTVGNNQVTEPWLDESLTQYITLLYYLDSYGEAGAETFRRSLNERWSTGRNARKSIDLETQAYSSREYAAIVYGLGPLVLDELAEQMGQNNFDALLKTYTTENFWEIASSSDFFALAEAYCACTIANRGSSGELWFNF